jgi:hypothetical protein
MHETNLSLAKANLNTKGNKFMPKIMKQTIIATLKTDRHQYRQIRRNIIMMCKD